MSDQAITLVKPKRRYRRRRYGKGQKGRMKKLAAQVSALSKRVGKPELKYATAAVTGQVIDFNGTNNSLLAIAQGLGGFNNRVADEIMVTGIDFRYHTWVTSASALTTLRVILYIDHQYNMTANTVLATTATSLAPVSFFNQEYKGRYKILYDKTHNMDGVGDNQLVTRTNPRKKFKVEFQPGLTTVRLNDLKVLLISNQATASGDRPTVQYNARIWYYDA